MKMLCAAVLALMMLAGCYADVTPVSMVDLDKYVGNWYQVYTNQRVLDQTRQDAGACVTIKYGKIDDNTVSVDNRFRPGSASAPEDITKGTAVTTDTPGVLSVSFDGVPRTFPYWVLKLGPVVNDQYDYSVVSDENLMALYVLTRDYSTFAEKYGEDVMEFVTSAGFTGDEKQPIATPQGGDCVYNFGNSASKTAGSAAVCLAITALWQML